MSWKALTLFLAPLLRVADAQSGSTFFPPSASAPAVLIANAPEAIGLPPQDSSVTVKSAPAPPSQAYSPTKYETSTCNITTPPTDLSGWKRWSTLVSWPGQMQIPGTGDNLDNVTIPCGEFMLFDVPPQTTGDAGVKLSTLLIEGHLMFLDDPTLQNLYLEADYIIVTGNLTIGSAAQHFRQHAKITLTGHTKGSVSGFDDVGFKVLAAAGGQLNLYGMPGNGQAPSWVSLTAPAAVGSTTLLVDSDVSLWPVGGKIAIASTDFDPLQAEVATIVAVSGNQITLNLPLNYSHFAASVPTVPGKPAMPMAAEVALLTRNILISGSQETDPTQILVGGHVIVYNTEAAQTFFGVEFTNLGQQGSLGRYPLHFHMCGPMPSSTVRKNSVHDSLQRGYVIHGTHQLTAQDNVAYNTTGHSFMFEDGIEQNNTLQHNLVINSNPASLLILQSDSVNTDNQPSCFWSATPTNKWVNNTGVGCFSGFWFELLQVVRGPSKALPGADTIEPFSAPLGLFSDNTAHSTQQGLQMYQHGYIPTTDQTFSRFIAYKNQQYGMVLHGCENLIVDGAMLSDHMTGVEFNEQSLNTIQNSFIIGQSANLGNTVSCNSPTLACEPLSGCTGNINLSNLPSNPGPGYRTVPGNTKLNMPQYGVVLAANTAVGNTFINFNSTCSPQGAIGIDVIQPGAVPVTGILWNNTFNNTPIENRIYIDQSLALNGNNQYWVARDMDGSTLGRPGYAVANGSVLLLPTSNAPGSCTGQVSWGGYNCSNLCYRSIFVQYLEPQLQNLNPSTGGTFLNVTRLVDSSSQIMTGYNNIANIQMAADGTPFWTRVIYVNLLGGYNYSVNIEGGAGALPTSLRYGYNDNDQPSSTPCNSTAQLNFPAAIGSVYT